MTNSSFQNPNRPAGALSARWSRLRPWRWKSLLLACLFCASGCDMLDMYNQSHYEPLEASSFFADGQSSRQLVPGTVARGHLKQDTPEHTGREGGKPVVQVPIKVDQAVLERGRERFNIYCSACHGLTGVGNGMIVQRGFRQPPSYHIDRLVNAPAGHYFDVITNGFGAMPRFAYQIEPQDRWAIVAYIRALQLSQHARLDDVPAAEQSKLQEMPQP